MRTITVPDGYGGRTITLDCVVVTAAAGHHCPNGRHGIRYRCTPSVQLRAAERPWLTMWVTLAEFLGG